MDALTAYFEQGVQDYWAGELPEGWDDPNTRQRSPYLLGWYLASMSENNPEYLILEDGS